nr:classA_beta_lactamase [uncultured bacterium]
MKIFRGEKRVPLVAINLIVLILSGIGFTVHSRTPLGDAWVSAELFPPGVPLTLTQESDNVELSARLQKLCDRAGASIGLALMHVETGRTVEIQGKTSLPLYSVFKLPLAIAVLKDVEENRLRLDQKVRVTPADVAPGSQGNAALWRKPVEKTVAELLELSIGRSDNTSSDKLLQLVGGPDKVMQRMRSLGFQDIEIRSAVRELATRQGKPNTGTASDLARLLSGLQQGQVLQPPQRTLLLGFMERATTGLRRLRGDLPAGTIVADKTGTGEDGSVTNDVGLITLPEGKGHLAMAVLISGSKLPAEAQEKLIAELAKTAYDFHLSQVRQGSQKQSLSRP